MISWRPQVTGGKIVRPELKCLSEGGCMLWILSPSCRRAQACTLKRLHRWEKGEISSKVSFFFPICPRTACREKKTKTKTLWVLRFTSLIHTAKHNFPFLHFPLYSFAASHCISSPVCVSFSPFFPPAAVSLSLDASEGRLWESGDVYPPSRPKKKKKKGANYCTLAWRRSVERDPASGNTVCS